jgi:hypothetical protein
MERLPGCKNKIIYGTEEMAQTHLDRLIATEPDQWSPLLENLVVYPHGDHYHVGHQHKTPLQSLLITVRRHQR